MQRRPFGNTGLSVSALGFGGAESGLEHAGAGDVERLLAGAIDAGLNVIDTASAYLESEELIAVAGERSRRGCGLAASRDERLHPPALEGSRAPRLARAGLNAVIRG